MPQPPEKKETKPQDVINVVFGIATIYSGCFTPLIRSGFGTHAFASYFFSMIGMYVYAGYAYCPQLVLYLPVWIVMVAFRRITADRTQHSRYQGFPWLVAILPFARKELHARMLEPWLLFFGGMFLFQYSEPLGKFVMGGCAALLVVLATEMEVVRARKRAMHDARVNAERMSDLSRGGDGWN